MVGLDIDEAKKFIEDEYIPRSRLEELVGKANTDIMMTINFVNNVFEKAKSELIILESNDASQEEIYDKLDFYRDLLYIIMDQMCNYRYSEDRRNDVYRGVSKIDKLICKYVQKKEAPVRPAEKTAPAPSTQNVSYNQQTTQPSKGSTAKGQGPAQKRASGSQPVSSKVWSTKDKNNIDRLLDNFNKRQKKQ